MCIYGTHEGQLIHALHFLKDGFRNNESCIFITNYLTEERIEIILNDILSESNSEISKASGDIKIVSAIDWFFKGQSQGQGQTKVNQEDVINSYTELSNIALRSGKNTLRAFVDMSIFFKYDLVLDLLESESKLQRIPNFPLKLICGYLESDISLLSAESYQQLQTDHRHVYLIPD